MLAAGHKWNNLLFHNHTGLRVYPKYALGGGYVLSGAGFRAQGSQGIYILITSRGAPVIRTWVDILTAADCAWHTQVFMSACDRRTECVVTGYSSRMRGDRHQTSMHLFVCVREP